MLPAQADSLTRYLPSLPLRDVDQFFNDLPQNVMLVGTAMAICGVVYSILTLSVYLFVQNVVLAAATYHAYKELCEAACMRENLERLESTVAELGEHRVNIGKGVVKLGRLQADLEGLRSRISEETERLNETTSKLYEASAQYARLNARSLAVVARHETAANRLYGPDLMV